jgi:hypothetical protein
VETLLPRAKDAAAAFSGLAAIAYACGYLVLRGRARALGTDPLLGLFEEAYVFAGFRFVLVTLLALLVGLPVIVLIRHLAGAVVSRLGGSSWLDWLALTAFAFMVMLQFVFALGVQGLLLAGEPSHGWLAAAALGENAGGALATVVLTILAALLVQWCMHLLPHASLSHLGAALILVTTMQVLLLPVLHGLFFADRVVRLVMVAPEGTSALVAPVAIVDRSKDRVTLLACSSSGRRQLVTLETKALDGVGVVAIEPLRAFLARLPCNAAPFAMLMAAMVSTGIAEPSGSRFAQQGNHESGSSQDSTSSFWSTLIDSLKVSFENISSLGESGVSAGEMRIVDLSRPDYPAVTIGSAADLSWPVIDNEVTVFALRDRQVLRFSPAYPEGEPVGRPADWHKLLGVAPNGLLLGLVADGALGRPATLSPSGELTLFPRPNSEDERRRIALLQQESRRFEDGYELRVDRSGRSFDVYLRKPDGARINVSNCSGSPCGQPSLSPDRTRVAFVAASNGGS